MAIAGPDDHVYTWYVDKTVSEGWTRDLDHHDDPKATAWPPSFANETAIDVAGTKKAKFYAWYYDVGE